MNYKKNEKFDEVSELEEEVNDNYEDLEGDFEEFKEKAQDTIGKYLEKSGNYHPISPSLENLASQEQLLLIQAFVDSDSIEKEYNVFDKMKLGVSKKLSKNRYKQLKYETNEKVIGKCAQRRIERLEKLGNDARELLKQAKTNQSSCSKEQRELMVKYTLELNSSKRFQDIRAEAEQYKRKLNHALKKSLEDGDLDKADEISQACEESEEYLSEITNLYKKANITADAIQRRMKIAYPKYVRAVLSYELLQEQSMSLDVAHNFYTSLYKNLNPSRTLMMLEFQKWNYIMDEFFSEYSGEVKKHAEVISNLLKDNKDTSDLSSWKTVLEKYKKSINSNHEKLFKELEENQKYLIDVEIFS